MRPLPKPPEERSLSCRYRRKMKSLIGHARTVISSPRAQRNETVIQLLRRLAPLLLLEVNLHDRHQAQRDPIDRSSTTDLDRARIGANSTPSRSEERRVGK